MKRPSYLSAAILIAGILAFGTVIVGSADENETLQLKPCQQQWSLNSLRAQALAKSPLVAEIDKDYANALASAFETEALENPELHSEYTVTGEQLGGAHDPQVQISIGQPLSLSTFGSKSEVARLIRKSGDLEKRVKLMQLLQDLTLRYDTLAVFQRVQTLIEDAEKSATQKVLLIKQGVRKGLLSDGDQHLFEGEKFRLKAQANKIASTIFRLRSELALSTGIPCVFQALVRDEIRDIPSAQDLIAHARASEIGETARLSLLSHLTQKQMKLASIDAYPRITPQFIYQHTNDGGDFFGAGFTIPLPFWNRNQSELKRAKAERKVVETRSSFVNNGGLENQIITMRQAVVNAREHSDLFASKVIPSFEKALKSQERLYYQGKSNVLQVWQIFTTLNRVKAEGLQHTLEAKALRNRLSVLTGEEL
jgi:outer membrane protein TolC